jgi:hypothetical protein
MVFDFELLGAKLRLFSFEPPFQDSYLSPHLASLTGARTPVLHEHLPSGRPYLPGRVGDMSLAHTRNSALVAITDSPWRIGVDIEDDDQSLSSALESTLKTIAAGTNPLAAWTMSEAAFKCLDKSFSLAQLILRGDGNGRFSIDSPYIRDLGIEARGWTWLQADLRLSIVLGAPPEIWREAGVTSPVSSGPAADTELLTASRPEEIYPVRTIY